MEASWANAGRRLSATERYFVQASHFVILRFWMLVLPLLVLAGLALIAQVSLSVLRRR